MPRRERGGSSLLLLCSGREFRLPGARAGARESSLISIRALAAAFRRAHTHKRASVRSDRSRLSPASPVPGFFSSRERGRGTGERDVGKIEENETRAAFFLLGFFQFSSFFIQRLVRGETKTSSFSFSTPWPRARRSKPRSAPCAPRSTPSRRRRRGLLLLLRALCRGRAPWNESGCGSESACCSSSRGPPCFRPCCRRSACLGHRGGSLLCRRLAYLLALAGRRRRGRAPSSRASFPFPCPCPCPCPCRRRPTDRTARGAGSGRRASGA